MSKGDTYTVALAVLEPRAGSPAPVEYVFEAERNGDTITEDVREGDLVVQVVTRSGQVRERGVFRAGAVLGTLRSHRIR